MPTENHNLLKIVGVYDKSTGGFTKPSNKQIHDEPVKNYDTVSNSRPNLDANYIAYEFFSINNAHNIPLVTPITGLDFSSKNIQHLIISIDNANNIAHESFSLTMHTIIPLVTPVMGLNFTPEHVGLDQALSIKLVFHWVPWPFFLSKFPRSLENLKRDLKTLRNFEETCIMLKSVYKWTHT